MDNLPLAKKSLGQHWLEDDASLEAMCDAAGLQPGDTVLEIGPGYGTLTEQLLAKGTKVVALEFDESLVQQLAKRFRNNGDDFLLIQGDIRTFDLSTVPYPYKVVANIPYYLTSNLIQLLSESTTPPSIATLLVQKEVAQRVAAAPGDMSILSITAQFYWEVSLGREVAAELFTPPPKVDSQILILKWRQTPIFESTEPKDFFRLVKAGVSQKRKTLLNSLSGGLHLGREEAGRLLERAGIDPGARAQTLALEQWHQLYLTFQKA